MRFSFYNRKLISFCVFLTLLTCGTISTSSAELLSHRLENLKTGRLVELNQFNGKTVLLSFFRPRCTSCKAQLQELNCVSQKKSDIQIFAVGLGENSLILKQTLMGTEIHFPSLWASPEFLAETGPIDLTPTTLIISPTKKVAHKLVGLKNCEQILAHIPHRNNP